MIQTKETSYNTLCKRNKSINPHWANIFSTELLKDLLSEDALLDCFVQDIIVVAKKNTIVGYFLCSYLY